MQIIKFLYKLSIVDLIARGCPIIQNAYFFLKGSFNEEMLLQKNITANNTETIINKTNCLMFNKSCL